MEQDSKLRICHIDLFNVRNEEHFYSLLAQKVIAATSTKWEDAVEIWPKRVGVRCQNINSISN